jgi:hypothetical protein
MVAASNLYQASDQWAKRPADERFWTLDDMLERCEYHRATAGEATVRWDQLSVVADNNNLCIVGPTGVPATMTNWSFGQLCSRAASPKDYITRLPRDLATQCINHGLSRVEDKGGTTKMLIHRNGSLVCRSVTSEDYSRIWNADLVKNLTILPRLGWRVPPARPSGNTTFSRPATEADVLNQPASGLSVKVGDMIAPAGLYASDHDMFAFMVNDDRRINDGSDGGLGRGFFVSNSEVGAGAFKLTTFYYRYVCGNHICWGVENVKELSMVHRGRNNQRFGYEMGNFLRSYADASASQDEGRIIDAKRTLIGTTMDETVEVLFKRSVLPKKTLEAAYKEAEMEASMRRDVSPRSVWGMVQGITALSQKGDFCDKRTEMDRAAGKVLQMAF